MYHRMYLRRCSMSSISEESELGDDDQLDDEFIICDDNDSNHKNEHKNQPTKNMSVENCLGDLNSFKKVRFFSFQLTHPHINFSFKQEHVCLMVSVSLHSHKLVYVLYT